MTTVVERMFHVETAAERAAWLEAIQVLIMGIMVIMAIVVIMVMIVIVMIMVMIVIVVMMVVMVIVVMMMILSLH